MPTATATLRSSGTLLASTDTYETVEGNIYFPPDSFVVPLPSANSDPDAKVSFQDSSTTSVCPWKGTAHYYSAVVSDGGETLKDVAWYYPKPKDHRAEHIKGYVAFYKTKVDVKVV